MKEKKHTRPKTMIDCQLVESNFIMGENEDSLFGKPINLPDITLNSDGKKVEMTTKEFNNFMNNIRNQRVVVVVKNTLILDGENHIATGNHFTSVIRMQIPITKFLGRIKWLLTGKF